MFSEILAFLSLKSVYAYIQSGRELTRIEQIFLTTTGDIKLTIKLDRCYVKARLENLVYDHFKTTIQ